MQDYSNFILVRTTDLRIRVPKKPRTLNPLEGEEFKSMVTVATSSSPKELQLMWALGAQAGLRINEILTFNDDLVRVPQVGEKRVEVEIGPNVGVMTKFGKKRCVEVPANLMTKLYEYSRSERRAKRIDNDCDFGKFVPLFINQRGNGYSIKSVEKLWGDLRERVRQQFRIPFKHDIHDLRASYGTYRLQSLLEAGVSPADALKLLMDWMGHEKESTTWKYLVYLRTHEVRKEAMTMLDMLMEEALSVDYD